MISLVIGLMIGIGLAFLQEYLDNTVKSEQDIERLIGAPILGEVAAMNMPQSTNQNNQGMTMKKLIAD